MKNSIRVKGATGKYQFRSDLIGSQVLWIQELCEYYEHRDGTFSPEFFRWRKAKAEDLPEWYESIK